MSRACAAAKKKAQKKLDEQVAHAAQTAMEERRRTVAKVNAEIARGLEERRQKGR
mgnify:CR=1 FL=1